jgi:glycosyltransferase involved in cell wall biosynthesis
MPRIAFLLPDFRIGGAERVALTLIEAFVERGMEVDLVLMRAEGELLGALPDKVHVVSLDATHIRNALLPLLRYLRDRKPDALQASMWPLTIVAILARALGRSPTRVVVSDHNNLSQQYGSSSIVLNLLRWSVRLCYPHADARVCVSSAVADDLARLAKLDRGLFEVIYNPIPPAPELDERGGQASAGPPRRILNVGSLKHQKNQQLLLRAFACLQLDPPAELTILGEGALRPDLERLARELGISDRVSLPGFALDTSPYYRSADLFVLSSDYEGFANVLVEAMAAGLPVVSTDCESGPREVLDNGRYGRLVPVGDVEAMTSAIEQSLAIPYDPHAQRKRAQQFRPQIAVDRYLKLLLG